jgi:hypothetical protein
LRAVLAENTLLKNEIAQLKNLVESLRKSTPSAPVSATAAQPDSQPAANPSAPGTYAAAARSASSANAHVPTETASVENSISLLQSAKRSAQQAWLNRNPDRLVTIQAARISRSENARKVLLKGIPKMPFRQLKTIMDGVKVDRRWILMYTFVGSNVLEALVAQDKLIQFQECIAKLPNITLFDSTNLPSTFKTHRLVDEASVAKAIDQEIRRLEYLLQLGETVKFAKPFYENELARVKRLRSDALVCTHTLSAAEVRPEVIGLFKDPENYGLNVETMSVSDCDGNSDVMSASASSTIGNNNQ